MAVKSSLEQLIWRQAESRCEYCHLPANCDIIPFCIDHIIALKHHGPTLADNLALSCTLCNSYKLDNLTGLDPTDGSLTRLFHPRRDVWSEHFAWNRPVLLGLTAVGRATIDVLKMNLAQRVDHRLILILLGKFPQP